MEGLSYTKQGWKPGTSQSNFDMNAAMRSKVPVTQTANYVPGITSPVSNQGYGLSVPSAAQQRMNLRNQDFNTYAGNTAGSYIPTSTPTMADINANPEAFANYDFSKMDAGSLGTDATPGMFDGVTAGGVMQGIDIGLKGWNAYNQYKGLGLAKDMFEREKAVTDANFINQQKLINIDRDNSRAVGLALGGGAMTADQIAADTAAYNKTRFSEKGIGA